MKTKFKKAACLAFILIISTCIMLGCSKKIQQSEIEKRYIYSDYKGYKDDKELLECADVVVLGKVIKTYEPQKLNINLDKNSDPLESVYTVCDVQVERVIKGDIKNGQVLQIKQNGGLFENVEYIYEEQEYLKENMDYLVFLESYIEFDPKMPYSLLNPIQASKLAKDSTEKDRLVKDMEEIKNSKVQ